MSRREKIEAMLRDDPDDTFLRYSLAMEQANAEEYAASLTGLTKLTEEQPPYVPAFFMGAQQLAKLSRLDEARAWLRSGIEAARDQDDAHAASEMSEFLASLGK